MSAMSVPLRLSIRTRSCPDLPIIPPEEVLELAHPIADIDKTSAITVQRIHTSTS